MTTTKPLKILQVGPLPPPVGGMATVIEDLRKEQEKDHKVRVLNTVKTTSDDRSLLEGVWAQLKLITALKMLCLFWRPDVVHIHTCSQATFWRNSLDVLISRTLMRKVVLHIHGARFHKFLGSLSGGWAWWARRVFAMSNATIVLGDQWKKVLEPWCPPGRVYVVPNGVPVPEAIERSRPERWRIICMANYEERKGQADLIRAVAAMEDSENVELLLPGFESESGQRQVLLDLAAKLGMADRVDIPGPLMGQDKEVAFAESHIFCLPSYDEGLPMSMLEAMARGLPVLVTSVGAIPEVIVNDENGLMIEAGDIDAMTAALSRLTSEEGLAERLGVTGRQLVIDDFSVARVARQVDGVYRAVIA